MAYDETVPNAANDWDDDITQMRANFDYLKDVEPAADETTATNVNAAGAVMESDYDANTILAATSDNTPTAVTISEQTIVGRITSGSITGLTASEVRTLINVENGADVTNTTNVTAAGAVMKSLFEQNYTIIYADFAGAPAPLIINASTVLGRTSSSAIKALSASELRTILDLIIGTTVQAYDANTSKTDVAETRSASLNMADNELIRPHFKDVSEVLVNAGNTGAACAFDLSAGNVQYATVDQNTSFTFTNAPSTGRAGYVILYLTNAGAHTIDWTGGGTQTFKWAGGTAPALTASGVDVIKATCLQGSTGTWYGFPLGINMS